MLRVKELATWLIISFDEVKIEKIDRLDNKVVDELAVVTSNLQGEFLRMVPVQIFRNQPSVFRIK